MQITRLSEDFLVAPQIDPYDMPAIQALGIAVIICNRPDGEAPDQPNFSDVKSAAEKVGITAVYIPMENAEISDSLIAQFHLAMEQMPRPVLAYCRTGNRSSVLWSAYNADHSVS